MDNLVSSLVAGRLPSVDPSTPNLDIYRAMLLEERTRIALLQGLFAVSLQLRTAADSFPEESADRLRGPLETMDRVLEEGRLAVQGLRSSCDPYASLGHALADVPKNLGLQPAAGFRVVVEGRQRELKAGMCEELYRIGREAIINALRHSHANHIEAEIEYRSSQLRLAVRDNGCGIDPQLLRRQQGHWGLQGMRERAERIGARLRILSKVALGTEVELCVPSRLAF